MDATLKDHYKKNIVEQTEKLSKDIESLNVLSQPISPDNAIGRISRMEAINDKSVNDAALEKLKIRKLSLAEALRRVDFDDDYGFCLKCEEEISAKRLEIFPESTMCVECINEL